MPKPEPFREMTAVIEYHGQDCRGGKYRYELTRAWGPDPRRVVFIMLNPSTADAEKGDPTMNRCVAYAKRWGYDGMVIVNLFAFCATKPADLWRAEDPIGPRNDEYLRKWARAGAIVVCAWGAQQKARDRAKSVLFMLTSGMGIAPYALNITNAGAPGHPLYLRADASLIPMIAATIKS
jgi:hypothetical protein